MYILLAYSATRRKQKCAPAATGFARAAVAFFTPSLDEGKEQRLVAASCADRVLRFRVERKLPNVTEFIHEVV